MTTTTAVATRAKKGKKKVVVVVGTTGAGKSQLAVELALELGGEVVSADALQLYEGLDILTNKVTPEESRGVPHHLISIVDPFSDLEAFINSSTKQSHYRGLKTFLEAALDKIEEIDSRNKVPIVVGGSNYYIEALLWDELLSVRRGLNSKLPENREETGKKEVESEVAGALISAQLFDDIRDEDCYGVLSKLDPEAAKRLHPNNIRKIKKHLQQLRENETSNNSDDNRCEHRVGFLQLAVSEKTTDKSLFFNKNN